MYYGTHPAGPKVVAVSMAFGVLTFIVLALRLFARIYISSFGKDDILIIVACLLSWAFIIVTVLATQHGLGSHIESIPLTEFTPYLQIVWLSSIFYNACLGFIKISVLALYIRLADLGKPKLQILAMIMMGIVAFSTTANVLVCIFQCAPIQKAWDLSITDGRCDVNINAFYIANAVTNIATDVLTYVLPIGLIHDLHIPSRQKIAVGVMLCLGFFACLSSIVRITYVPVLLTSPDATYAITDAMYWSVIETNIGILAASIPTFTPLAKRYLPRLIGANASKIRGTYKDGVFVEIGEDGRHRGTSDIAMNALYGQPVNINTNCHTRKGGHGTSIASSEENILPPAGKILAQTHISIRSDFQGGNVPHV